MSKDEGVDDLIEWATAQVADDESRADVATAAFLQGDRTGLNGVHPSVLRHVYGWTPARVLRLTSTLRRLLDGFSYEGRETFAIMALVEALYADRPGYREEWRPA